MRKILGLLFLTFLICVIFTTSAKAAVITVCSSGCDSQTVQGGINLASNWDEVRITDVNDYNESIIINKTIVLTSNTTSRPTIFSAGSFPTINITADNVTISKLTVKFNDSVNFHNSIYARSRFNITITNNNISSSGSNPALLAKPAIYFLFTNSSLVANNNISVIGSTVFYYGIFTSFSTNDLVQSNNIFVRGLGNTYGIGFSYSFNNSGASNILSSDSPSSGFLLTYSNFSNIVLNKIFAAGNLSTAVFLSYSSSNNVVSNNLESSNDQNMVGINVVFSTNNSLISNNITTIGSINNRGIYISANSNGNRIISNNISAISKTSTTTPSNNYGIYILSSSSNDVESNIISTDDASNNYGIRLSSSTLNTFLANKISTVNNQGYGIYFDNSISNYIYSSIINAQNSNDIFLAGNTSGSNFIINSTFNEYGINFTDQTVPTKLFVQNYLDVLVQDKNSAPVYLARVQVNDTNSIPDPENPTASFTQLTNSSGYIPKQILSKFMATGIYEFPNYLYFSNYTIDVIHPSFLEKFDQFNFTTNTLKTITLTAPTSNSTNSPLLVWDQIQALILVNQNSTKNICFVLKNLGNITASNIYVSLTGIQSSWQNTTPTFFSSIIQQNSGIVCTNFNIPFDANPTDYLILLNASDSVSNFSSFTLRVSSSQTLNITRDQANQSLQLADQEIQNAMAAGKNVTAASSDYDIAVSFFLSGDYNSAKLSADKSYNEALNAPALSNPTGAPSMTLIYLVAAAIGVLIVLFSFIAIKGRGSKARDMDELKEKWSEDVKSKLGT